jgi:LemA protein
MMTIIILVLFLVVIIYIIYIFNLLISRRNAVKYAFGSIDALLKKRFDLIPNLVFAAKKYMNYEQNVLNQLTQMRTQFKPGSMTHEDLNKMDSQTKLLIRSIFATAENYPDLKASQNVLQLQAALNEVEEQISAARRTYNATIMEYNNVVNHFPSNIMASIFNFKPLESFSISDTEKEPVDIGKVL